jgi:hypothetical protein
MRLNLHAMLLLGLGCGLVVASRLNGQGSGLVPGNSSAPKVCANRSWGVEQPRFRAEEHTRGVRSPAQEVQDLTKGGAPTNPRIGAVPEPLFFKPTDIHIPTPEIKFPPLADHSGEIGAIFSIATPVGILIAITMMGLARRRQERASQGLGSEFTRAGPESHSALNAGRSFVKLGADGKGGIMYLRER